MGLGDRRAGALKERIHFAKRGMSDDGWGTPVPGGPFETQFTLAAAIAFEGRGDEAITASRLAGIQPMTITVRYFAGLDDVTAAWQLEDARRPGRIFAIKAPPQTDPKRQWTEIFVIEGAVS
jgi:head-tail adaptor